MVEESWATNRKVYVLIILVGKTSSSFRTSVAIRSSDIGQVTQPSQTCFPVYKTEVLRELEIVRKVSTELSTRWALSHQHCLPVLSSEGPHPPSSPLMLLESWISQPTPREATCSVILKPIPDLVFLSPSCLTSPQNGSCFSLVFSFFFLFFPWRPFNFFLCIINTKQVFKRLPGRQSGKRSNSYIKTS